MASTNNHINPTVSICIPFYKQPELLKRNLKSIEIQEFKDFEVIITDDSPEEISKEILNQFGQLFTLRYYKNSESLGSPKNWNYATSLSNGQFIIVLHQDDYFSQKTSLTKLVKAVSADKIHFAFGNIQPDEKKSIIKKIPKWLPALKRNPEIILRNNIIGPPSNVIFRASNQYSFDENLIWAVDYELYFTWLSEGLQYTNINEQLVTIGKHDHQITKFCDQNPLLKLNEEVYLFNKHQQKIRLTFALYDYYWRNIRNNRITNKELIFSAPLTTFPVFMKTQIQIQNLIGFRFLKNGFISKLIMSIGWILFLIQTPKRKI